MTVPKECPRGGGSERLTGHDPSEREGPSASEGTCPGRREAGGWGTVRRSGAGV